MSRKDIPNWIGKPVTTIDLTKIELQHGLVVSWNDLCERFLVKMVDGSIKLFKPYYIL
jgi:hypothetical protein